MENHSELYKRSESLNKSSICSNSYSIEVRDVDFNKDLKLSSLFSYFQEIASLGSSELGIGLETIQRNFNVTWVLLKINVNIIRTPKLHETIKLETWPQEPKTLQFERDFLVYDEKGEIVIRATSIWAIIDLSKRMIMRSRTIAITYPPIRAERAHYQPYKTLSAAGELELAYKKVIGYSDIDMNGHLNNAKYIDFIMDCFTIENHKQYMVQNIEINFIHELMPGESLLLYRDLSQLEDHVIYIEGRHETNMNIAFKVCAIIKDKKNE